ncbi:hypothetical protein QTI66_39200 [Variovorax sp. J22R133]|uniref:hypothetical protein n=1 Tax=Variovorax brevis TaxID=3053503 RepID=UPI00257745A9|nr:hypothetical protein [Variovorax sp. J22R133]MDM0118097.1 hypothetical protein [Variovorax sp. J22R133]
METVKGKVDAWAAANKVKLEVSCDQGNWMARDPRSAWLSTLLRDARHRLWQPTPVVTQSAEDPSCYFTAADAT